MISLVSNERKLVRLLTRKMFFIKFSPPASSANHRLYRLKKLSDVGEHIALYFVDANVELLIAKPYKITFFSSSIPFLARRPHIRIESDDIVFTDNENNTKWIEDRYVEFLR